MEVRPFVAEPCLLLQLRAHSRQALRAPALCAGTASGLWSPSPALAAVAMLPFVPPVSESSRLDGNPSDRASVETRTFALSHSCLFTCASSGSEGLPFALGVLALAGPVCVVVVLRAEMPVQTGQDRRTRPFEGSLVQWEFVETLLGGLSWPGCPSLCCAELGNALCSRQSLLGAGGRSLGPVACPRRTCARVLVCRPGARGCFP